MVAEGYIAMEKEEIVQHISLAKTMSVHQFLSSSCLEGTTSAHLLSLFKINATGLWFLRPIPQDPGIFFTWRA